MDAIVANAGDPPLLLHNSGAGGNHFLNFKLAGTKSNRDAMGARIKLRAGGIANPRDRGRGQLPLAKRSARALRPGREPQVDAVEVTWPSGTRQRFQAVAADRFYVIDEGKEKLGEQAFGKH